MSQRETAILLLSCKDRKGIVAEISHFISTYEGNILHSDQHFDEETKTFFMRIEWDLADFSIAREKTADAFEPIAEKFKMSWQLEFSSMRKRIAIFVSKFDHCLYDLLLRHTAGELSGDIRLVVSNHKDLEGVADYFRVPFYHFPITKETKEEVEERELSLLAEYQIDLIILARYMQIVGGTMVERYHNRIINIHHSFLPAFVGAKPYHQAHSRGVKIIGATSHYVTSELDQGPIIEQDVVRITHRDAVADLIQKGRNLEKLVLSKAV
ncbi:MAG TPA: formyltetrahydrofolate deformylase, partial [Spirochaetia bacterium]|nr:formyltetrahydrofolate deformylase [Spirochaetia bacterium]